MGTEGDRRRNRARRIREKEQKKIKKKWDIPLIWIIGIAFFSWFSYEIYKGRRNPYYYTNQVQKLLHSFMILVPRRELMRNSMSFM